MNFKVYDEYGPSFFVTQENALEIQSQFMQNWREDIHSFIFKINQIETFFLKTIL